MLGGSFKHGKRLAGSFACEAPAFLTDRGTAGGFHAWADFPGASWACRPLGAEVRYHLFLKKRPFGGERMRFTVVAVGKLKERFWTDACAEYLKRLQPYAKTEVREIADVDPGRAGGVDAARDREGAAIVGALSPSSHVVLLAIDGKQRSSEGFSQRIDALKLNGASDIAFVIGGSDGVSAAVRQRADETLSFGPVTLPHNLARVVLLEQLYRAQKISRGEPYHK